MISKEVKEKGLELFKEGRVKKEFETSKRIHFSVAGETETHFVIYDKQKKKFDCDCMYMTLHGKMCSHALAAKYFLEKSKGKPL
jgi:hypothetical protein